MDIEDTLETEDESAEEEQQEHEISEEDLLKIFKKEVEDASLLQDERQSNQEQATDYFYGRLPGVPTGENSDNMSAFVSTDVADAVESVLAEIVPAFSGQSPVEFVPSSEADEAQADLETRAVNHTANSCGAFMAINMAGKDALLRRAGIVKVWWEDKTSVKYEPFEANIEVLPQMMQAGQDETVEFAEAAMDEMTGMVSGSIRRYTKKGRPRIAAVPRDEFLISSDATNPNADEARFVGHQRPVSRSYLIELGFDRDTVEELKSETGAESGARAARYRDYGEALSNSPDPSTEQVMVVEGYYHIDFDGDGIAELRRIVTGGGSEGTDELLINEPWDAQPFCIGVPYLGIYSWDGVSLFDKLKSVQDVKTALTRDLLDATRRNVRQRIGAVEREVNMDDLMSSVMGGVVRMKSSGGVFPIPDVQIPPQLFNVLQYMDEVRKDKGGGAIDAAAQVNALAGDTAHGLERMMSAAEQVNAMVAKNLAETLIKPLYLKLHALLRSYQQNPLVIPGSTGWQSANPAQWSPRDNMVVSLGMSVGERTRRSAALGQINQQQMMAMGNGMDGILVSPVQIYQTLIDQVRMAGLPSPEQYWINPASPEAQQAAQAKQQAAQQQAQIQQQAAQQQLQVPITMEQIKAKGTVESAQIRSESQKEIETLKAQNALLQANMDMIQKTFDQRLKLIELNAKYDGDPVPDNVAPPAADQGSLQ